MHDCTVCELRWTSVFEALPLLTPLDGTMDDSHLGNTILVTNIHRADQRPVFIDDDLPVRLFVPFGTTFLRCPRDLRGNAQAAPESH